VLVLGLKDGDSVRLIDESKNLEIGVVKRIQPRRPIPDVVLIGFDFPDEVRIVRDSLVVAGKDTPNGRKHNP